MPNVWLQMEFGKAPHCAGMADELAWQFNFEAYYGRILSHSPFLAGLGGGMHCLGMCGPFVAGYSVNCPANRAANLHGLYQAGRLFSYLGLGLLFGWIGHVMDLTYEMKQLHSVAALVGGSLMVFFALAQLGVLKSVEAKLSWRGPAFIGRTLKRAFEDKHPVAVFGLGFYTALLPCGLLFTVEAMVTATADPVKGAMIMAAFWLGNLPYLLGAGVLMHKLSPKLRGRILKLLALGMLVGGVYLVFHRLSMAEFRALCGLD